MKLPHPDPLAERVKRATAAAAQSIEQASARSLAHERAVSELLAVALNAPPAADLPVMVLLVDDQAIIAEALRRALADEPNVDLHYCADPASALAVARETRPTVILQDLVMPGVDGLTLVRQYREHPATRDIPIIVLSTKEEPRIKSAAFAAGANDYLVKLPDTIELVARVRYHSRSYQNLLQRDEAYRALRQSQQKLLETNLELQRLTHSDGLTGLSNRRRLDDYLDAEWRRAARDRASVGFLMIDVDNFKSYNDTYGHVAGDDVLKLIAHAIETSLNRPADLAARFGGEEFAVVLPSTSAPGLRLLGEKIRIAVEALQVPHAGSATDFVTVSVGGATQDVIDENASKQLVESADLALYRAKRDGRNRVIIG
ncbi:diguanylate cyclase [Caballeronia sp. LP006]|jgi:two-component system chemotaxis family response regulator WspR|uniref:diguanylate cyclase n=1 Tax=unclassified Caballeronia TaxID=2646786 RepID=UPI002540C0DB|nr:MULTISPECIES: diguanylate cyclase [unclassified Caballeronia]MDR5775963.1 diguanylate cyclase [Caballeronia sp. LZ002]MDR5801448.1 diguanylate cyclase [Caballeronia sp. LZ001]MDR5828293.1 diguanylate cyclase [Caballeronia sp. LP006]MDR5851402.1 diguanylate cyclase [Caballeronia sp. LZ003]